MHRPLCPVRVSRLVAAMGIALFSVILFAQHAISRGLGPDTHTISEYANARYGWLMTSAFVAWAAALVATAWLARCARQEVSRDGRWWSMLACGLTVASAGLVVTAAFKTQTSAGMLPPGVERSLGGRLHDWGSGLALLALLAAVCFSLRLTDLPRWFRRSAACGAVCAVVADVGLLVVGEPAPGLRQRLLVVLAISWQAGLLVADQRRQGPPPDRSITTEVRATL